MHNNDEMQQIVANLVMRSATQFSEGKSRAVVISRLKQDGCTQDMAEAIATRGEEIKKSAYRRKGVETIFIGVGLAGLGVLITALTYSMALGGYFVVMTGLIMVGAWYILKGLWRTLIG